MSDVLVVGAGFAGLYAARLLRLARLSVTVLEARDRVGGRVLSERLLDGSRVDLGAQWIGPGQRRMYALAHEFGLKTTMTYDRGDAVIEWEGRLRRMPETTPPLSWIGKLDVLQLGWRIDRIAKKLSVTEPWQHPRSERLDGVPFTKWLKDKAFSEEARSYWRYIVESGMCANSDDFSLLEVSHQIATMGGLKRLETADHEFFETGTQTIAQRLAEELGDRLRLVTPVQALQREGRVVRAVTNRGMFGGQRAILALPPQLVKTISFDSNLTSQPPPNWENLVLGKVVKSIIVYERAWWREKGLNGSADTPSKSIQFLADTSNSAGQPGVLVALSTGPRAETLIGVDSKTSKSTVLSHVRRVLGQSPTEPKNFFYTDWTSEPWSLGGYASRQTTGGWTNQLNAPIVPYGPIHFAGTETATEWRSYMEGALQSAERASKEVIDAFGR